jgi:hypothetical protein
MATECLKPFRGKVMRITKLTECGAFTEGVNQVVTTKGFVSIEQTLNWRDPDEYEVVNANGELCVNESGAPQLKWIDVVVNLCEVDVEAHNFMTGSPLVLDDATPTPNNVGMRLREGVYGNYAIEVWTDLAGAGACAGGTAKYGYMLLPWITNGVPGDVTIENAAASFSVRGRTRSNSPWGVGWANIRNTVPAPAPAKLLTAIASTDHRHLQVTNLAPPTAACGSTELAIAT